MSDLSRLKPVNLVDVFPSEPRDFTPWLAEAENLALLGETLHLELEHEATEKNVGPFRADILCKDVEDGNWVLIENQLGRTDHTHLGQLMTYASGLKAVTIIWIAAEFTEEHRAAMDWLNSITEDDFRFFGVEVELWRIDESAAAPRFNIVSKPNAWSKSVRRAKRDIDTSDISGIKAEQLLYWQEFSDRCLKLPYPKDGRRIISPQAPRPQHWIQMSIGRSGFNLAALVNSRDNSIGVELVMSDDNAKPYFYLLEKQKDEIESEVGEKLRWRALPEGKQSKIDLWLQNEDFRDQARWESQHAWLIEKLERFHKAFSGRVRALNHEDYDERLKDQFEDLPNDQHAEI